jgi:myo-inositol 2-dehydrogenase / D-chiro-inositol 1-dehydrogenase
MTRSRSFVSRRRFLQSTAAGAAALAVVPRNVLGQGQTPPSEEFGGALVGCGGRGGATFNTMGPGIRMLAQCDVKFLDRADNQTVYADYRRVMDRNDIHVVAIATPPHWHALVSIAAMASGKDVMCEKPMTKFIAEGRAVVEAERRYNRVFQICTFGRFGASRQTHKLMASGLLTKCDAVVISRGGFNVRRYCGMVRYNVDPIPPSLDWDMYCGPAPLRPFNRQRFGGSHRFYWDYEGGGLADFGQHKFDGPQYAYAKDFTSPVEVEAYAPPQHPEACGLWGWVELRYADGLTFVMDSGEWGEPYNRRQPRGVSENDLTEEDRQKLRALPDPEPLVSFADAIRTRQRAGGHAESSHRGATLLHLANLAIRTGRKIRYDPDKEEILGDEEANRLAHQPMRAPWQV